MHSNWAAEHLLVIRTLMERSAIYRRALAPIVILVGTAGMVAALLGWGLVIEAGRSFVAYWSSVGFLAICGAYIMARRQALKDAECFWSAPTCRVTQALVPALFVGFVATAVAVLLTTQDNPAPVWWLIPAWMVLYGCAVHAAGFFMPRGMKLFGWGFILGGCGVAGWLALSTTPARLWLAHWLMGGSFGGWHLAYGVYLYFTEKRKLGM